MIMYALCLLMCFLAGGVLFVVCLFVWLFCLCFFVLASGKYDCAVAVVCLCLLCVLCVLFARVVVVVFGDCFFLCVCLLPNGLIVLLRCCVCAFLCGVCLFVRVVVVFLLGVAVFFFVVWRCCLFFLWKV